MKRSFYVFGVVVLAISVCCSAVDRTEEADDVLESFAMYSPLDVDSIHQKAWIDLIVHGGGVPEGGMHSEESPLFIEAKKSAEER